ncbi:MAG: Crp/Fnr family transcriptional regulator [Chloroflexota bacterium]|nr:Crp/Fnr family transcriptional regulator [Chloroflexota bacterium]
MHNLNSIETLKKVALFHSLTSEELEGLSNVVTQRSCLKSEIIYESDKPGEECFILLKGWVKLCLGLEDGREVSFEILGPGDFFGEGVLLESPCYNCTAQAIERVELLGLTRRQILQLMENNGHFSLQIARYLVQRLADFRQRQEMLVHGANIRFARLLLTLAKRYGTPSSGSDIQLNLKLTHQEMANLIGTARETITLTIGKFRNEGILAGSGSTFVIKDRAELERRAWPTSENNYNIS